VRRSFSPALEPRQPIPQGTSALDSVYENSASPAPNQGEFHVVDQSPRRPFTTRGTLARSARVGWSVKPAAVTKVLENLELAKGRLGSPPKITISTVIEEWNVTEVERLLDWCGEQGFVFAAQSAQMEKMPNLALLKSAKYQALVDKIIERRREGKQAINGTPKTIETLLRFRDFQCYPTMFPRVYPNGDVFYPCEPLRKIAGNLLRDGSLVKIFAAGKKKYGDIPPCQGICYLFGNVLSHYYVNDFWGLAGDFIR